MKYPAAEKPEIIRIVEQLHMPAKRTLDQLGIARRTFYRWHQIIKNRILLENYFLHGALEAEIEALVKHYNNQRYHESLNNVRPANAYFGRASAIVKQRERIKRQTIEYRRLQNRKLAA